MRLTGPLEVCAVVLRVRKPTWTMTDLGNGAWIEAITSAIPYPPILRVCPIRRSSRERHPRAIQGVFSAPTVELVMAPEAHKHLTLEGTSRPPADFAGLYVMSLKPIFSPASSECSARHPYAKHRPSAFAIFSWNLNAPLEPSYFPFTADNSAPKFNRAGRLASSPRPEQCHCRIVAASPCVNFCNLCNSLIADNQVCLLERRRQKSAA